MRAVSNSMEILRFLLPTELYRSKKKRKTEKRYFEKSESVFLSFSNDRRTPSEDLFFLWTSNAYDLTLERRGSRIRGRFDPR